MHPLPPYAELLGLRAERRDGETLWIMPYGDAVVGRPGYLHGGAIAGLAHGYAFGESIFGAERTPLAAYLVGLVVVQSAIAIGIAYAVRARGADRASLAPRLTGAAIAGIGLAVLAQQVVPAG